MMKVIEFVGRAFEALAAIVIVLLALWFAWLGFYLAGRETMRSAAGFLGSTLTVSALPPPSASSNDAAPSPSFIERYTAAEGARKKVGADEWAEFRLKPADGARGEVGNTSTSMSRPDFNGEASWFATLAVILMSAGLSVWWRRRKRRQAVPSTQ